MPSKICTVQLVPESLPRFTTTHLADTDSEDDSNHSVTAEDHGDGNSNALNPSDVGAGRRRH